MRTALLLTGLLLATGLSGCIVPENMTALREELGYASVELPDLVVKAQAATLTPRVNETVTLTATIQGVPTDQVELAWELGRGEEATGSQVTHAWTTPGPVTVQVTASTVTAEGDPVQATDDLELTVRENQAPMPRIDVATEPALAGEPIRITAAESTDPDGDPLTFTWRIDGQEAGEGTTIRPTLEAGLHTVRLTARDGWTSAQAFHEVGVAQPLAHAASLTVLASTAELPLTVEEGAGELTVHLAHTTTIGLEDVALRLVDGDGQTVAEAQTEPELGTNSATEAFTVDGGQLAPGNYVLVAELVRGVSSDIQLEGLLTYGA